MKIIAFEAENVKNLRLVQIKPDGSMIVVGGDNAQGKTCVLDSIEYALNGAGAIPSKPIRTGQKKARVVLDLGDIIVTRTFTEKGTNLTVKNKDGATFASPQAMLDKLVGELTFDPLEFSKMDAKKQADVLRQLVGLDFTKINAQYQKTFNERTIVNRDGKATKSKLDSMVEHNGVPDQEVSVADLSSKYSDAVLHNQGVTIDQDHLDSNEVKLKNAKAVVAALEETVKDNKKKLKGVKRIDVESIQAKIASAANINANVRENKAYAETNLELLRLRKQSGSLSAKMTKLEADKIKALAKAKFPIKGLAVDDDIVTFEDIPFIQCSAAQRIRISVAIGLKMNPKLRVLLIREGSLLDEKNLGMVAEMADDADAQIWLERVSKGSECSVILEDGAIKED